QPASQNSGRDPRICDRSAERIWRARPLYWRICCSFLTRDEKIRAGLVGRSCDQLLLWNRSYRLPSDSADKRCCSGQSQTRARCARTNTGCCFPTEQHCHRALRHRWIARESLEDKPISRKTVKPGSRHLERTLASIPAESASI